LVDALLSRCETSESAAKICLGPGSLKHFTDGSYTATVCCLQHGLRFFRKAGSQRAPLKG